MIELRLENPRAGASLAPLTRPRCRGSDLSLKGRGEECPLPLRGGLGRRSRDDASPRVSDVAIPEVTVASLAPLTPPRLRGGVRGGSAALFREDATKSIK
jgi:hypothetical protein